MYTYVNTYFCILYTYIYIIYIYIIYLHIYIYMAVYENSVVSKACCMGGMIRRYVSRYVSEV